MWPSINILAELNWCGLPDHLPDHFPRQIGIFKPYSHPNSDYIHQPPVVTVTCVSAPTTISLSHTDSVFKGKFLVKILSNVFCFFWHSYSLQYWTWELSGYLYRSGFSHSKAELPASHLFVCIPLLVCLLYYVKV